MALDYSLALGTPMPTTDVARELHQIAQRHGLFDPAVTPERILNVGARTKLGLWIRVLGANSEPWDPVVEDLGFTPTVRVAFRLDKSTDMSAQQDEMVRLVSDLLDRVPGDAVLHFDFEYILLLRRGDELSLNERNDIWPQQRLAAVHQPYRRATYAFN